MGSLSATACGGLKAASAPLNQLVLGVCPKEAPEQQPPLAGFDDRTDQRLQIPRQLGLAGAALANRQPNEDERAQPLGINPRSPRARRVEYRHRHVFAP
jgi:hypothetical protein